MCFVCLFAALFFSHTATVLTHGRHAQIFGEMFGQMLTNAFGQGFGNREYSFTILLGPRNTVLQVCCDREIHDYRLTGTEKTRKGLNASARVRGRTGHDRAWNNKDGWSRTTTTTNNNMQRRVQDQEQEGSHRKTRSRGHNDGRNPSPLRLCPCGP